MSNLPPGVTQGMIDRELEEDPYVDDGLAHLCHCGLDRRAHQRVGHPFEEDWGPAIQRTRELAPATPARKKAVNE